MSDPAYHLRPNKAVDRFAFIEAIKFLQKLNVNLEKYTYYGLGGPYLEDMRLIYENYPKISMISIEEMDRVFKRQKFHKPCGTLKLIKAKSKEFIAQYESKNKKSIFWLDYTELHYPCFQDFFVLLQKVAQGSMIKITLRANPADYIGETDEIKEKYAQQFREEFATILPHPERDPPRTIGELADTIQKMIQRMAQQSLSATTSPLTFYPVSSFYYTDGTGIFTLTGVVWPRNDKPAIEKAFNKWEFANLNWGSPTKIAIPSLSTKERLKLQKYLPCRNFRGTTLRRALGYSIEETEPKTILALEQYAKFHRYFPYFLRGIP
jgi:hypothetical protein